MLGTSQNIHTNYRIQRLQTNVPLALDSVTTENINNYFRKVRDYMFAYLQGYAGGEKLEKEVKRMKKFTNLIKELLKNTDTY